MNKFLSQRLLSLSAILLLAASAALGQTAQKPDASPAKRADNAKSAPAAASAAPEHPAPKFDIANIDKSVDPCVDFYQYACGNWMKNNPIPGDQPIWLSFVEVYEHNLLVLRQILEKAAANDPRRSAVTQKIGDFYASCMDEAAVNKAGAAPLKPELDRIAAIKDKTQMLEVMAHEQLVGPNPLLGFGSSPDLHNADLTIASIDQSGLSLPDRDYYLKDDAPTVAIRKAFVEHVTKMLTFMGQSPEQAAQSADTVLKIETELAKASMERTLRRDPKNRDHKMTVAQAEALAPNFHFDRYFAASGAPAFTELNVGNPDYFKSVNAVVESTPLDAWKTYMTWHMLNNAASWLSDNFVQQDFKFQQAITGQKELPVRWKRCVNATDNSLGEALGQPYVDATFGAEGKARMLKMVDALENSLKGDITTLPWMTETTKKEALIKLAAIRNKIGYPDKWRDYSKLTVARGDLLGNIHRASEFESNRQLQKIGKPVDKQEWVMTPPTVNAYYSGNHNEIVFPAGILQPPFFDRTMDDAVNMGGIGLVIGHELTHGFDDQGRKFDPKGNLRDWWTAEDGKEFEQRASCVADEYSSFTAVDDLKLNGRLTLGENTADNGGARIALMALHDLMAQAKQDPDKKVDGYTPDQRFFLGFGRVWCQNTTPELSRMLVRVDPHSPGRWRVNGVVRNMPEFQKAFGCKAGQPMAPENACRVW
ncbi:MAG TPA: M13 family metallopeptidase [Candidatus Angelobacter sp.]|nr:M13 family metallopeptidase [Candidatus Angelobacter sp.]